jgi:hypothetical protein
LESPEPKKEFDWSKVECWVCEEKGHGARDYKKKKNNGGQANFVVKVNLGTVKTLPIEIIRQLQASGVIENDWSAS